MEPKIKNEKREKEFTKSKLKTSFATASSTVNEHPFAGTIEEQIFIGHSRNSRKTHYFQGSRN
jgi:hypothetical protein